MEDFFGDGSVIFDHMPTNADPFEFAVRRTEQQVHERDGWESYPQLHVVQVTRGDKAGMLSVCGWTDLGDVAKENPVEYMAVWAQMIADDERAARSMIETIGDAHIYGIILVFEGHGFARTSKEELEATTSALEDMNLRVEDMPEAKECRIVLGVPAYDGERFYNLTRDRATDKVDMSLTTDDEQVRDLVYRSRVHNVGVAMLAALRDARELVHGAS